MAQPLLDRIQQNILQALKKNSCLTAAFDADGTLWPGDVGRGFFKYQAAHGLLKISHPQKKFESIYQTQGRAAALKWLALIQEGAALDEIKTQARRFLASSPPRLFSFQQKLIQWMKTKHIKIFVVSSSLKWVLEEAAPVLDLPPHRLLGVETTVKNGRLTDQLILPAPVGEDKPLAFKKQAKARPVFAAGNTLSDQALLEYASPARLAVHTASPTDKNYLSERLLIKIAKQNNWFYFEKNNSSNSPASLGAS